MNYPTWPEGLPCESANTDWQVQPFRAPLQTDMEGGDTRIRRRPGDDIGTMRWARLFKEAEMADFEAFVVATNSLSMRWLMPLSVNGRTYETRLVQLGGDAPTYTAPAPGIIRVSMTLLVFPASVVPERIPCLDFSDPYNSQLLPLF